MYDKNSQQKCMFAKYCMNCGNKKSQFYQLLLFYILRVNYAWINIVVWQILHNWIPSKVQKKDYIFIKKVYEVNLKALVPIRILLFLIIVRFFVKYGNDLKKWYVKKFYSGVQFQKRIWRESIDYVGNIKKTFFQYLHGMN